MGSIFRFRITYGFVSNWVMIGLGLEGLTLGSVMKMVVFRVRVRVDF